MLLFIGVAAAAAAATASDSDSTAPTNVVVDFDTTSFDSTMSPGDSAILNLVIGNTGGYRADDIEIYIPSTGTVTADKRFEIGRLDAGSSKTLPVLIRVNKDAKTGLTAVNVKLNFDGFKADGTAENNQLTTWDVPLMVYGRPSFQLNPVKTTFYKDTLDELRFEGTLLSQVKDLEATLSSSCLTVIGSSRKYLGDLPANEGFALAYPVKPTAEGACTASVKLEYVDESGSSTSSNLTVGLNVETAGVDFKVLNISYDPTGPGETVAVKVGLTNVGKARADETTVSLTLTEPFVPVDTPEKYIGSVGAGETVYVTFNVAVGWDAEIQAYAIPLTVGYKVGGTSYAVEKTMGLDVSGQVILEVINVEQSRGSLRIEIANIGTRTAEGVKATLSFQGARNFTRGRVESQGSSGDQAQRQPPNPFSMLTGGGRPTGGGQQTQGSASTTSAAAAGGQEQLVAYKSDIKPTKQTTFTFDSSLSGPAVLTLEYTGRNNERVTQTERFTVGGLSASTASSATRGRGGLSLTQIALYGVVLAAAAVIAYKLYRRMKASKAGG